MEIRIRYGITKLVNGAVDDSSVEWLEEPFSVAVKRVKGLNSKSDRSTCGVFFYQDIKEELGHSVFSEEMNATREQFERSPGRYGVCLYLQPFSGGTWVFE